MQFLVRSVNETVQITQKPWGGNYKNGKSHALGHDSLVCLNVLIENNLCEHKCGTNSITWEIVTRQRERYYEEWIRV